MRIVVVGADAAGMSAAHTALRAAARAGREIGVTVVEATGHTSYSACGIPYWIAGDVPQGEDLVARSAQEHRAAGIDLRLGSRAVALDSERRRVRVEGPAGTDELEYDELVLATGAAPIVPDWARAADGGLVEGVHPVKNLDDGAVWTELLTGAAEVGAADRPTRAVVVGGGYIGLEMAEALIRRGLSTTLVTRSRVMSSLDADLGAEIEDGMVAGGVALRTGRTIDRLETTAGPSGVRVSGVVTDTGERLAADVVVLAIGVEPATSLGAAAGLSLGDDGGYLPDPGGRVAPGIWAAGDCCEVTHRLTGRRTFLPLGTHANKLGRVVGDNLLGGDRCFGGALGTAITRFVAGGVHLEIARTGLSSVTAADAGYDVVALVTSGTTASGYMPEAEPIHTKVIADRATRRLLGVQIVGGPGSAKRIDAAAAALWGGLDVDDLAGMDLAYAPPFATVWDALQIAARRLADRL
ncbi:FAD-dependent oxidoreductase [Nocardioides sp. LHD-245]|uniref:FAD-dependent oxidoreductase n=1 Tax=Nocardioides sp. LHD-245 TaxID=3051387 RepID=UPI0027E1F0E7|nr:FAD-dependent oxidoreductase [Nocardioides sp. LHD-245]